MQPDGGIVGASLIEDRSAKGGLCLSYAGG